MTEAEWLHCTDPPPMLEFLRGKGSDRKGCLVGCALWRAEYGHLPNERVRKIVEVAEQIANGMASRKRLRKLIASLKDTSAEQAAADWACGLHAAIRVAGVWTETAAIYRTDWVNRLDKRSPALCGLFRDIFGPLLFRPVVVDSSWLEWNNCTVVNLAQDIYIERTFDLFPLLADALEEAGCLDLDILAHCRQPGVHVRGCWVVDRLLAKE
jgi:hypothetical protein